MSQARLRPEGDGLLSLVRETLDGIGRLIGEHMKLARLEFQADLRAYGRALVTLLLVIGIFALAYGLACVGLAVLLSRWIALPTAFFLLAGVHVVVAAAAGGGALTRLRNTQPMHETAQAVERSVTALSDASAGKTDGAGAADARGQVTVPAIAADAGGVNAWPTTRP
ncbi:MAG TPA: phage holin family protein [Polyangia bacterium]|nr:phage holin family protein [Polyangia bacterium]